MFFVLMLPSFCLLSLEGQSKSAAQHQIDWQVVGGNNRNDYMIVKLFKGSLYNIVNNEKVEPKNTAYTQIAWDEFKQTYNIA